MPVRMDAQEEYRPLPPVVKARGPHGPDPRGGYLIPCRSYVTCDNARPRLARGLRTIRSTACEPRPTTLRASVTRRHRPEPRRACPATGAWHAAAARISSLADPRTPIAPDRRGTGRAWPMLSLARGRCAATRPLPDSRRRCTHRASSLPGTSVVTARPTQPPRGPAQTATQRRPNQPITRDRLPPPPGRRPILPDRSPDAPGSGRVPVSDRVPVSAVGTRSHPGG